MGSFGIILIEVYIMIGILFLAGKDASSYLLKDKDRNPSSLDEKRIKRWHRDGVALQFLLILPFLYYFLSQGNIELASKVLLYTLLLRLSLFDLAFNRWASLDIHSLGSTSLFDKIFSKIFGEKGAVKKSLAAFILLITLNILL